MAKSKYTKELREQAYTLAEKGCTDAEIIKGLGIGKDTFYRYLKKHKDFSDAIKKAREVPIEAVEASLYQKAVGYDVTEVTEYKDKEDNTVKEVTKTKHVPGDVGAMIFYLTNKAPQKWVNPQRTHLKAGNENKPLLPVVIEFARSDQKD